MPHDDRDVASLALVRVHEERMLASTRRRLPVPVLLVSGALGAGKTTLLNHILQNKLNLRVTCLVNDLAALNIDADVLVQRDAAARMVRLSNGCACHTLVGDLEAGMWQVLQEVDGADRVDYVVIETSGVVADPSSIILSLERRFGKMTRARLDGVALLVDADVLFHELSMATVHPLPVDDQRGYNGDNEGGPSASEAAATMVREANAALWSALQYADIVLLNKLDLLGGGASTEAKRLRQLLERAAPWAQIIGSEHGKVPLQLLLNVEYARSVGSGGAPGHEAALVGDTGGSFTTALSTRAVAASRPPRPSPQPTSPTPALPFKVSTARAPTWVASAPGSHEASAHGFQTLEFSSDLPLRLAEFQDLIAASGHPERHRARVTAGATAGATGVATERASLETSLEASATSLTGVRTAHLGLLSRVRRIKGVVWFAECRTERWILHLSGRQRLHLEHAGPWTCRPKVQLVVIGQAWQADACRLRAALEAMCVIQSVADDPGTCLPCGRDGGEGGGGQSDAQNVVEAGARADCTGETDAGAIGVEADIVRAIVGADDRFELVAVTGESGGGACGVAIDGEPSQKRRRRLEAHGAGAALVHFQLVGASRLGVSRVALERTHGVDVDALNATFVEQLNANIDASWTGGWRPKPCLTGALILAEAQTGAIRDEHAPSRFTVRFAVGGHCRFAYLWPRVSEVADAVLTRAFAHLDLCGCDHGAVQQLGETGG